MTDEFILDILLLLVVIAQIAEFLIRIRTKV